jgi:hypothetical protein
MKLLIMQFPPTIYTVLARIQGEDFFSTEVALTFWSLRTSMIKLIG